MDLGLLYIKFVYGIISFILKIVCIVLISNKRFSISVKYILIIFKSIVIQIGKLLINDHFINDDFRRKGI